MARRRCHNPGCRPDGKPRPTHGPRVLCDHCTTRLHTNILDCGIGYARLTTVLAGLRTTAERMGGNGEIPLPVRVAVLDVREAIRRDIWWWVGRVCAARGLTQPPPTNMPATTEWLAKHVDWLATDPQVPDLAAAVAEHRRAAHMLCDIPADRTRFPVGPCPEHDPDGDLCQGRVVARIPRDITHRAVLACDTCGTEWDARHWLDIGRRILTTMGRRQ